MQLRIIGPVCRTGYGITATKLALALAKVVEVELVPLGAMNTSHLTSSEAEGLQALCRKLSHVDATLGIWHEFDQPPVPIKDMSTYVALPTFELDRVSAKARECLERCRLVMVSSKHCLDVLEGLPNVVQCCHHGVDMDVFTPGVRAENQFRMLNVGKLEFRKGHDICIRVLAAMLAGGMDPYLWCMWDNPFMSAPAVIRQIDIWTRAASKEFDVSREVLLKHVLRVGARPSSKSVALCTQMCNVGLYPSRAEGFNLPLLEAMACGLEIVATNETAPADYLDRFFAHCISAVPAVAEDGIWFGKGKQEGMWWEPDFEEVLGACVALYLKWKNGESVCNLEAVSVARGYTWDAAASRIIETLRRQLGISS